jgi:hypothetical protein
MSFEFEQYWCFEKTRFTCKRYKICAHKIPEIKTITGSIKIADWKKNLRITEIYDDTGLIIIN